MTVATIDLVNHLDLVNQIAEEYIKGNSESVIAKTMDLKRTEVVRALDEWRAMIAGNDQIRQRAGEALAGADKHYNLLIKQTYEVIDEATLVGNLSAKTNGIKLVLDIESKRIEMLQKAGLLENKELAEQMIENERKQALIIKILQEVPGQCQYCKPKIVQRLTELAGDDEALVV